MLVHHDEQYVAHVVVRIGKAHLTSHAAAPKEKSEIITCALEEAVAVRQRAEQSSAAVANLAVNHDFVLKVTKYALLRIRLCSVSFWSCFWRARRCSSIFCAMVPAVTVCIGGGGGGSGGKDLVAAIAAIAVAVAVVVTATVAAPIVTPTQALATPKPDEWFLS